MHVGGEPQRERDRLIAKQIEIAVLNGQDKAFAAMAFANRHLIVAALNSFAQPKAIPALERTLAAGRIVDVMTGGNFDWRSRLEDGDFLQSGDWLTALAYADAALSNQPTPKACK